MLTGYTVIYNDPKKPLEPPMKKPMTAKKAVQQITVPEKMQLCIRNSSMWMISWM